MLLYLVQHGVARPKEEDPDCPLTDRGAEEVHRVAEFVASRALNRGLSIYESGKTRALQTAQILASKLTPDAGVSSVSGLAPMDDPTIWADRLKDTTEDIMLVGHLPHLSRLASLLVCGNQETQAVVFRNAGVVCLRRDDDGAWAVAWIVVPELLK